MYAEAEEQQVSQSDRTPARFAPFCSWRGPVSAAVTLAVAICSQPAWGSDQRAIDPWIGDSEHATSSPPRRPETTPLARAKETRSAGQVLTAVGAIPVLLGTTVVVVAAISDSKPCAPPGIECEGTGPLRAYGVVLAGTGVPFIGAGIPLWVHGPRRMARLQPAVSRGNLEDSTAYGFEVRGRF